MPENIDDKVRDSLISLREIRLDWLISRRSHWKAVGLCIAMGAWGVVSGYVVFLNVWKYSEETKESHLPVSNGILIFVVALIAAAVVAFIAESMRELIKHGKGELGESSEDETTEHRAASQRPFGRLLEALVQIGPRIVVTILMLAFFELYVAAFHTGTELFFKGELQKISTNVLLPITTGDRGPALDLAVMATLWIVTGAFLSGILAYLLIRVTGKRKHRVLRGFWVGGLTGIIAAPLGVIAYILLVRSVAGVIFMVTQHQKWQQHLDDVLRQTKQPLLWICVVLVNILDGLWQIPYVGPLIVLSLIGVVVWRSIKKGRGYLITMIGLGLIVIFAAPLMQEWKQVLMLPLLAALIWGIPGSILGMTVPYLKRPSTVPKVWGFIALSTALFLLCLTWFRLAGEGFLIAILLLLLAGILLLRSRRVRDYWPLLSLSSAMLICGWTAILQKATFFGVLEEVHAVNSLPASIHKDIWVDLAKISRDYPITSVGLGEASPDVKKISARLNTMNSESLETQREHLNEVLTEVQKAQNELNERIWESAIWKSKGGLFPMVNSEDGSTLIEQLEDDEIARRFKALRALPFDSQRATLEAFLSFLQDKVRQEENFRYAASQRGVPATTTYVDCGPQPIISLGMSASEPSPATPRQCLLREILRRLGARQRYFESMVVNRDLPEDLKQLSMTPYLSMRDRSDFSSLQEIARQSEQRAKKIEVAVKAQARFDEWKEMHIEQNLELALAGSLGFWVTVGLLAGWSVINYQTLIDGENEPGLKKRCFWARGEWLDFHDREHGVRPANDHDLFKKLSLEVLGENRYRAQHPFFARIFGDFVPETVASLSVDQLRSKIADEAEADRKAFEANFPERIHLVIENARRLLEFYKTQGPAVNSSGASLLEAWKQRTNEDDPSSLISYVRDFFLIPKSTMIGTFLQSTGFLPAAHFYGCFRYESFRKEDQ